MEASTLHLRIAIRSRRVARRGIFGDTGDAPMESSRPRRELLHDCLAHEGNPVLRLLPIAPCGGVLKGETTCCMEVLTMDFSLNDYLDEDACYTKLVELLHPDGLACPRCGEQQRLGIHRCH